MIIRLMLFICILILTVVPAKAWNSVGHRVIAEIVWQHMSAADRHNASELLKHHPHYKELLTSRKPAGVDENEWAFLTAAIWPDMIRHGNTENITKYNIYPHAIGYPFMLAGQTNHALIEKFFIARPDAEMVLSNSFLTLKNTTASPHDRAVALCWALHLCGDLHQPLHAANLVTKEHPNGDQLGGHHIVLDDQGHRVSMHSFWDALLGSDRNFIYTSLAKDARAIASDKKLKRATQRDFDNDKTIASWVQESFHIAVEFAYQGGRLPFAHESDVNSGKVKPEQIPKLTRGYISEAHNIARQRAFLAAQRLSAELNGVW
jgi:hypothetical protein